MVARFVRRSHLLIFIDFPKFDYMLTNLTIAQLLDKLKTTLKNIINKTPIPSLLSIFYNPKARDPNNPTLSEITTSALDPSNNWMRLGLDKTWWVFVILAIVLLIRYGTEVLVFFINFGGQLAVLLIFVAVFYFGWKKFKG